MLIRFKYNLRKWVIEMLIVSGFLTAGFPVLENWTPCCAFELRNSRRGVRHTRRVFFEQVIISAKIIVSQKDNISTFLTT
jgi:hypothetical protein